MSAKNCLPVEFDAWFKTRGWQPRTHQLNLLARARDGCSALLIAPTGAGKTLAGFLPSLVDLNSDKDAKKKRPLRRRAIHTLYISPLKALAVDVARNVMTPIDEMELSIRVETRTGDTPSHRRQRQRYDPPDILMTTPEQVSLLLAHESCETLFGDLKYIIFDELHALVTSKRGDLLSLCFARLNRLAPNLQAIGLSATVADPQELAAWLVPQKAETTRQQADLIIAEPGAMPDLSILASAERVPWSGHSSRYAMGEIYQVLKAQKMALIFVNTRSQAEMLFHELWRINDDGLPIALHHGSLDVGQRRKVEAAMADGKLKAVVCTSTLDLGIDWGDVDMVINVGAPKGSSRLMQRIGRANHRLDEPSKAILIPSNRFEVMECQAAVEAARQGAQDTPPQRTGALDVLAQHILGSACAAPFDADILFGEVKSALPYAALTRQSFDRVLQFVATGGYALQSYDRFARLKQRKDGLWRIAHPRVAQQYRLNIGTIIEEPMLKVRLVRSKAQGRRAPVGRGGRVLGEIEEFFIDQLAIGDTFMFGGEILQFEGLNENEAFVSRSRAQSPKIPAYMGGKFPLSTYLAARVREIVSSPEQWQALPDQVGEWLRIQKLKSQLPRPNRLLVETFPRGARNYLVCYPFEGRLAHQTLGMLLTRRMERAHARPMGFVANEYALAVWGLGDFSAMIKEDRLSLTDLFDQDMLGDDLDAWLAESSLMKRTFRSCAIIAGLIEKRHPGKEKTGRQMTVSADLIYDVLRQHEPDHILLQATWADAATGLLDIGRLGEMLARIAAAVDHVALDRISPLAVPVMLEIGREPVYGEAQDTVMAEAADDLIAEAMGDFMSENEE